MWFTETAWPPAILIAAVAACCLFVGLLRARRSWLIAAVVIALLIPAAFIIERMIVTPGEEIERLVIELRNAVVARDVEATLAFLSPQADLERAAIRTGMALGHIKPDVEITDLHVNVTANSTAVSHFRANGTFVLDTPLVAGERHVASRWELMWRREAGAWKVYGIDRLHPVTGEVIPTLDPE